MWLVNGSMANILWGRSTEAELAKYKRPHTRGGKRRLPIRFRDFVKHVFREHNQEADHWANIGAQGQRKIVPERCDNSETWKTVKGYWDGSFKDNGKSGCAVVIKGVDWERWVTISKIAVPLKVGTVMAAEVCVLTGNLDLVFNKFVCSESQ